MPWRMSVWPVVSLTHSGSGPGSRRQRRQHAAQDLEVRDTPDTEAPHGSTIVIAPSIATEDRFSSPTHVTGGDGAYLSCGLLAMRRQCQSKPRLTTWRRATIAMLLPGSSASARSRALPPDASDALDPPP